MRLGRCSRFGLSCGAIVAALLCHGSANAAVVHVDLNAPLGGNGATWATAYNDLATGLAGALAGDEIWVAKGTYAVPGTPFQMTLGAALYGGFAGTETLLSQRDFVVNLTELDGQALYRIMDIADAATATTVIDGFTFKNGSSSSGGAIYSYSGAPTLANCRFTNNASTGDGAVGYLYNGAFTMTNCVIDNNTAAKKAGALYAYNGAFTMTNCVFKNNTAAGGNAGAIYAYSGSYTMTDCVFDGNTATGNAGAIYAYSGGSPVMVNCLLVNNSVTGPSSSAGAIYRYGSSSNPAPLSLINCTFTNNSATSRAGALYDYYGQTVITNTIIHGNTAPSAPNMYQSSSYPNVTISYSCIEGGYAGTGNIAGPPNFVAPTDYRLNGTSPCIDAGDNTAVPAGVVTDLAGQPRFSDEPSVPNTGNGTPPIVDMGAYEVSGCLYPTFSYGTGCAGTGSFVPLLQGSSCANIGQQFNLTFKNALGGALAYLFGGIGQASLPMDPFCTFLLTPVLPPLVVFPLGGSGPGAGTSTLSFTVPPLPVGLSATVQYFTVDAGAPMGYAGSNGVKITFN